MYKKINNNFDRIFIILVLLFVLIKCLNLKCFFDVLDGCLYDGFVLNVGEIIII